MLKKQKIPPLFKWLYGVFMALYIPVFWVGYGAQNFLWLSSIALILAFFATLFESRFLASMATLGGLVPEMLWTLDFLYTMIAHMIGSSKTGFTEYMFNSNLSLWLRIIALYHLILPPLLIWLILRLGYDRRAWIVQVLLGWMITLGIWFFTSPLRNINFVFEYEHLNMRAMPFLAILFVAAIALFGGTHLFLRTLHRRTSR